MCSSSGFKEHLFIIFQLGCKTRQLKQSTHSKMPFPLASCLFYSSPAWKANRFLIFRFPLTARHSAPKSTLNLTISSLNSSPQSCTISHQFPSQTTTNKSSIISKAVTIALQGRIAIVLRQLSFFVMMVMVEVSASQAMKYFQDRGNWPWLAFRVSWLDSARRRGTRSKKFADLCSQMIYSNSLFGCKLLCTLLVLLITSNTFQLSSQKSTSFSSLIFCVILHTCGFNKQKPSLHSQYQLIVICDSICAKMSALSIMEISWPALMSNLYCNSVGSSWASLQSVNAVCERFCSWRYLQIRVFTYSDFIMIDIFIIVGLCFEFGMGPCMSGKHVKMAANLPVEYQAELETDGHVVKPLQTTLYNTLRKGSEIEIIRISQSGRKMFFKESTPNLAALDAKDLKMLFSFKNILFIGEGYQEVYQKIKAVCNPKQVLAISEDEARTFLARFPIFSAGQPINEPKVLPIYAMNSQQILKKGPKREIFLHSASNQQKEIYSKLKINAIVEDKPDYTVEQAVSALQASQGKTIAFLHGRERKHEDLLNILSSFLVADYGMAPFNAQVYIRRCLPQIALNSEIPTLKQMPTAHSLRDDKKDLSLTENYQKHLSQLYTEMGSNEPAAQKLSRSVNLLTTLLSNIYSNKGNDSYRKVRKTNKQIDELLGKYKWGVRLLKELGFQETGTEYVNNTDVKYLKIYRTDLEVAYRNLLSAMGSH